MDLSIEINFHNNNILYPQDKDTSVNVGYLRSSYSSLLIKVLVFGYTHCKSNYMLQ